MSHAAIAQHLQRLMNDGVAERIFSGAQAGIYCEGSPPLILCAGHTCWEDSVPQNHTRTPITMGTRFDLASLTKAVVTAPLVWFAVGQGLLRLDDSVSRWLSDWRAGTLAGVTVRQLLNHTSGLPAWLPLYTYGSKEAMLVHLLDAELEAVPGQRAVYSDAGYILLGLLLHRCLGDTLDRLALRLIFEPLGMRATRYVRHHEGEELAGTVAATEATLVARQGPSLVGQVHDENGWMLGGVAPHAGLFSHASDLLMWGQAILAADQGPAAKWAIPGSVVRWALSRDGGSVSGDGALVGSHMGGLDSPSGENSTAGSLVRREPAGATVGHLGFTGTSIWIDRTRRLVMVLLTNRVHPDRDRKPGAMRAFRVAFHTQAAEISTCNASIAPRSPVLGGVPQGPALLLATDGRRELEVAIRAAREAGSVARALFLREDSLNVQHKGDVDLVTRADLEAEALVVGILSEAFPGDGIMAEEQGGELDARRQWLVDPIDGTTNYSNRLPHFCVSIALRAEGQLQVGVIYDPMRDELFWARRHGGAWLNGRPICVSPCRKLIDAVAATGFPYDRHTIEDNNLDRFEAITKRARGVRRYGAAALDLAYTAAGRFDLYWEGGLKPWDLAAGVLLVEEAGGRVTAMDGSPFEIEKTTLLATGGGVHDEVLAVLTPLIRSVD